jgi:hypothetical protein
MGTRWGWDRTCGESAVRPVKSPASAYPGSNPGPATSATTSADMVTIPARRRNPPGPGSLYFRSPGRPADAAGRDALPSRAATAGRIASAVTASCVVVTDALSKDRRRQRHSRHESVGRGRRSVLPASSSHRQCCSEWLDASPGHGSPSGANERSRRSADRLPARSSSSDRCCPDPVRRNKDLRNRSRRRLSARVDRARSPAGDPAAARKDRA